MLPFRGADLVASPPPPLDLPKRFLPNKPTLYFFSDPVPYDLGYQLQLALVTAIKDASHPPVLLLLEHEPVATLGRSMSWEKAPSFPLPLYRTHRGGQITFHGRGQITGYPIVNLRLLGLGVGSYIELLEHLLLSTCTRFSAPAFLRKGLRGVFTPGGKIASVGISIRRGVSWHGFALNYAEETLSLFLLPPCGLEGVSPDYLRRYNPAVAPEELVEEIGFRFFQWLNIKDFLRLSLSPSELLPSLCPTLPGSV
jgi:lipoyl(octanoyl) transferase